VGKEVTYASGWNQIDLPAGTLFPNGVDAFFTYDPVDGYAAGDASNTAIERKGWAFIILPTTVTLSSGNATPQTYKKVGWNLVGNPSGVNPARVTGSDVVYITNPANGGQYDAVGVIPPGYGGWAYVSSPDQPVIVSPASADTGVDKFVPDAVLRETAFDKGIIDLREQDYRNFFAPIDAETAKQAILDAQSKGKTLVIFPVDPKNIATIQTADVLYTDVNLPTMRTFITLKASTDVQPLIPGLVSMNDEAAGKSLVFIGAATTLNFGSADGLNKVHFYITMPPGGVPEPQFSSLSSHTGISIKLGDNMLKVTPSNAGVLKPINNLALSSADIVAGVFPNQGGYNLSNYTKEQGFTTYYHLPDGRVGYITSK
jgi:hypothetical protein